MKWRTLVPNKTFLLGKNQDISIGRKTKTIGKKHKTFLLGGGGGGTKTFLLGKNIRHFDWGEKKKEKKKRWREKTRHFYWGKNKTFLLGGGGE